MKKLAIVAAILLGGVAASQAGVNVHIGIGNPRPVVIPRPAPVVVAPPVWTPAPVVVVPHYGHYRRPPVHYHGHYHRDCRCHDPRHHNHGRNHRH